MASRRLSSTFCRTSFSMASSSTGAEACRFLIPSFWNSSFSMAIIFLISLCAYWMASLTVSSDTSVAPASTIAMASSLPATTMFRRLSFTSE